jgi:cytochrome c
MLLMNTSIHAKNLSFSKIRSLSISVALSAALFGLSSQAALANADLMKAKNCTACHNVDRKSIGPAFKEIATKYGSDPKAVELLVGKVRNGGVGTWGNIMMPANPQVSAAEAETLVRWVLSQK